MKKLIIGIGFTALLAATSLHAGLSQECLTASERELKALETWLTTSGKKITNSNSLKHLTDLAAYSEGRALIAKYPNVGAQLQAHTTKATVTACAKTIAKLPPAAQESCMAHFKSAVASFITKHKTGINRTVMIALLAGSIYYVCATHPEILDYVKVMLNSAWTSVKNVCSEVWNPQAGVDAAQATVNTTGDTFAQSWQNLRSVQTNENIANSTLASAQTAVNQTNVNFDCTPHLAWYENNRLYKWLNPATLRDICESARQSVAKPFVLIAQNAQRGYDLQQAIVGGAQDAFTATQKAYTNALAGLDAAQAHCASIELGRKIVGGVAATGLGLWGALKAKVSCLKSRIAGTQSTK